MFSRGEISCTSGHQGTVPPPLFPSFVFSPYDSLTHKVSLTLMEHNTISIKHRWFEISCTSYLNTVGISFPAQAEEVNRSTACEPIFVFFCLFCKEVSGKINLFLSFSGGVKFVYVCVCLCVRASICRAGIQLEYCISTSAGQQVSLCYR